VIPGAAPAIFPAHVSAPVQSASPEGATEVAPGLGFSWDRRWVASIALVALVFAAFWPSLSAEFVNWDDDRNFVFNDHYRGFGPSNLWWMWTSYHMAQWHPLTWMTLGLDWCLWGPDAAGYHLTNVVIHALAALAAFFFARRLFAHVRPQASALSIDLAAFFATAFFAIHPLRVESVAWVTERRDVLSGLFAFLTLGRLAALPRRGRGPGPTARLEPELDLLPAGGAVEGLGLRHAGHPAAARPVAAAALGPARAAQALVGEACAHPDRAAAAPDRLPVPVLHRRDVHAGGPPAAAAPRARGLLDLLLPGEDLQADQLDADVRDAAGRGLLHAALPDPGRDRRGRAAADAVSCTARRRR
jgi:hypothetical protein